jgi:(E)-2-((N-methylformamido)methylene)succinate hydrolase
MIMADPVILIHGVGGNASNWDEIVPYLLRSNAVTLDLRGHGSSPPIRSPITVFDFARDVAATMDRLNITTACVAGFSLGGQVAQALALEHPQRVRKLALIATVSGRTEAERAGAQSRITLLKEKGLAAIAEVNRERWFTPRFQAEHPDKVQLRVSQLMQTDAESYLHAFTAFARDDLAERLGEIRAPTLVVAGEHDAAATPRMAQLMHERIANSTLHVLHGLRHSLLIEAPEQVGPLLARFFA